MKRSRLYLPGLLALILSASLFSICAVAYAADGGSAAGEAGGKLVAVDGLKAEAVTAPTSLWVEPTETNGIPMQIDLFKKTSGTTTVYQLYLPGNVVLSNCFLTWDGGVASHCRWRNL